MKVNAWEEYFYDKLMNRRSEELKWYQKKFYSETLATYSMWLVPKLILAATFGTYVALGNHLTPPIASEASPLAPLYAFLAPPEIKSQVSLKEAFLEVNPN